MIYEKEQRALNILKEHVTIYDDLMADDSPLHGSETKDLFLLAMALGYKDNRYIEPDRPMKSYVRVEYLKPDDRALIDSIAIAHVEGKTEILSDPKIVFDIAEGYAIGGIFILKELAIGENFGSFSKRLELKLMRNLKDE